MKGKGLERVGWRIERAWVQALLLLFAVSVQAATVSLPETVLHVAAGKQRVVTFPGTAERVAIGDPAIADVEVVSAHEILLTAKQPGTTSLHVWQRGEAAPWQGDVVVTSGVVPASVAAGAPNIEPQVQTDIKVVEISRQKLKSAGIFLSKNTASTTAAISPPGTLSAIDGSSGSFALESTSGFLPDSQAFNLVLGSSTRGLLGVLSALENSGFAYTLAEPSLVSLSGQTASFLVGGEFPIPVVQGSGTSSSITITYKEFGVRLMLTPTVLDADHIVLKVAPEVSELDFTAGVESGGVVVPALRVRRTDTSVQLGNGESFVISGLVSQNTLSSVDKVPGLGDLPILGAFFRSSQVQKEDKELIMIVTPHLVRPLARNAATPALPGEAYRRHDPGFADLLFKRDAGQPALGGFSE